MEQSELLKLTRQYFWSQNFTEVEVNYLQKSLPLEPNLYAFQTDGYYLPTSPEFALKQFLAENKKNCFSIAHCFRHLESSGPHHRPEFLMLEYYLVNQNLSDLQHSVQNFISSFLNSIKFLNFVLPPDLPTTEPDFNQYFLNEVEPKLPRDRAVFVSGYPAFLSPLARTEEYEANDFFDPLNACISSGQEKLFASTRRFELYINGIEIANGCEENRDFESIKLAFTAEKKYRHDHHLPTHPISQNFINHSSRIPPCAGVGIGLDRLLMVINHQNSI